MTFWPYNHGRVNQRLGFHKKVNEKILSLFIVLGKWYQNFLVYNIKNNGLKTLVNKTLWVYPTMEFIKSYQFI